MYLRKSTTFGRDRNEDARFLRILYRWTVDICLETILQAQSDKFEINYTTKSVRVLNLTYLNIFTGISVTRYMYMHIYTARNSCLKTILFNKPCIYYAVSQISYWQMQVSQETRFVLLKKLYTYILRPLVRAVLSFY